MSSKDSSSTTLWKALGWTVLGVAVVVVAWKALPVEEWARAFLDMVEGWGPLGPLVFGLVYVLASVLGVPRTPLNIGAGIVFPFPVALALVLTSAAVAFAATFGIARYLASEWVEKKIEAVPNAQRVMEAVEEEGFKLVLLLRMNPFVPAVVKGYGFGTTSMDATPYLLASVLGFLPIACGHVAIGWLGGAAMMDPDKLPESWRAGILIGGGLVSVVLVAAVSWYANKALNTRTGDPA